MHLKKFLGLCFMAVSIGTACVLPLAAIIAITWWATGATVERGPVLGLVSAVLCLAFLAGAHAGIRAWNKPTP
jgi:hypothetical protein